MDEEYERERERVRLCARLGEVDAAIDCVRRRMAALEARYLRRYEVDDDDDDDDDVFADTCAPVSSCDTLEHNYDTMMMMDVNDDDDDDDVIEPE
jgi:hypothetical protein